VEIQNGAYYTEGDIVYVNNNGVPTPATTPSELWGADANSIIELGEGTKLYDELMTKRRAAITSGEIPAQDIYNDPAKLAVAKEIAQPVVIESKWNENQGRRLFEGRVPEVNTPFIYNGKVYIASSGKYFRGEDNKEEAFDAIDAETGDKITIRTYALPSREDQEKNNTGRQSDTEEDDSTTDDSSTTRPRGRSLIDILTGDSRQSDTEEDDSTAGNGSTTEDDSTAGNGSTTRPRGRSLMI
jgi:hypothetical protein